VVPTTPLKECSLSLHAHSQNYLLQKGVWLQHSGGSDLSLPDLFYWAGLNCSSWRAPQKAPWLAVLSLWPRSGSPWPLLTGWSSLLALSTKNRTFTCNTCNNTPTHRRGDVWTTKNNINLQLHRIAVSDGKPLPPETGIYPLFFLPSGSRCSVWQFHFKCWHLPFPIVKVTFQISKSHDTSPINWIQPCQRIHI
jgi:hypothetical protein